MTKYLTFFPLLRPGDPRTAVLLRAAVWEPTGDAGESLWGAPARPGHSPDASPPHHAPLGCLPGLRKAAAAGLYSSYTYSDITTIWCMELVQNAHGTNLPPVSLLNSNSSCHQLNKSKANGFAWTLPSHVTDCFTSGSGNQKQCWKSYIKWQHCEKAFGRSFSYITLVPRRKHHVHFGHYVSASTEIICY